MVPEAGRSRTEGGIVPQGAGWFVLNAREARWQEGPWGRFTRFEGADDAKFPLVGINLNVLAPGQPLCMYHGEDEQEDFLVLEGECLLLIEGEERPLHAWDFVHCPPWTEHVFVGAGECPCLLLAIGSRREDTGVVYPRSEVAVRHGAGVEQETREPSEAYARFPDDVDAPWRDGDLPA